MEIALKTVHCPVKRCSILGVPVSLHHDMRPFIFRCSLISCLSNPTWIHCCSNSLATNNSFLVEQVIWRIMIFQGTALKIARQTWVFCFWFFQTPCVSCFIASWPIIAWSIAGHASVTRPVKRQLILLPLDGSYLLWCSHWMRFTAADAPSWAFHVILLSN